MSDLRETIGLLADGKPLSRAHAREAFDVIMSGRATPAQTGAFLMALRVRGETVDEITAAAEAVRARALVMEAPEGAVDTCGTGGDARGTLNISTAAAIIAAGAGVPVAKHGNKAVSSKSGSADVLTALGIDLEAPMEAVERALAEANITFLLATRHHAAMRHVAPARGEMGIRTIFNLIGPLANPAGVTRQVLGVYDARWVEPMAKVLRALGNQHAWVVHGAGGLDELSTLGPSRVAELKNGAIRTFEVDPAALGLAKADMRRIRGGKPASNARRIRALLAGEDTGPFRDIACLNAAAALLVGGKADSLKDGLAQAFAAVESGRAQVALKTWAAISRGEGL